MISRRWRVFLSRIQGLGEDSLRVGGHPGEEYLELRRLPSTEGLSVS